MPTRDGPEFPDANVPIVYAKTFLGEKNYVSSFCILFFTFSVFFNPGSAHSLLGSVQILLK